MTCSGFYVFSDHRLDLPFVPLTLTGGDHLRVELSRWLFLSRSGRQEFRDGSSDRLSGSALVVSESRGRVHLEAIPVSLRCSPQIYARDRESRGRRDQPAPFLHLPR